MMNSLKRYLELDGNWYDLEVPREMVTALLERIEQVGKERYICRGIS